MLIDNFNDFSFEIFLKFKFHDRWFTIEEFGTRNSKSYVIKYSNHLILIYHSRAVHLFPWMPHIQLDSHACPPLFDEHVHLCCTQPTPQSMFDASISSLGSAAKFQCVSTEGKGTKITFQFLRIHVYISWDKKDKHFLFILSLSKRYFY